MWGALGFVLSAVIFVSLALSSLKLKKVTGKNFRVGYYAAGLIVAAVSMAIWAFASYNGTPEVIEPATLVADSYLFLAVILLINSWLKSKYNLAVSVMLLVLGAAYVYMRAVGTFGQFDAYMENELLILNTPRVLAGAMIAVVFSVWTYTNIKYFAAITAGKEQLEKLSRSSYFMSLVSVVGLGMFLIARKPFTITVGFGFFVFGVLSLSLTSYLISLKLKYTDK